jgi:predicted DNA-binding WGR domain protein
MIADTELGRYVCIGNGHKKFWHIAHDVEKDVYLATWGKIGNRPPPAKEYTEKQARKKIDEKLTMRKGYVYTKDNNPKWEKVRGSVAVAFILSLDGED